MVSASDFLREYVKNNVKTAIYNDHSEAQRLAQECRQAAIASGIGNRKIDQAAGGNLYRYMMAELDGAANREIDRLASGA